MCCRCRLFRVALVCNVCLRPQKIMVSRCLALALILATAATGAFGPTVLGEGSGVRMSGAQQSLLFANVLLLEAPLVGAAMRCRARASGVGGTELAGVLATCDGTGLSVCYATAFTETTSPCYGTPCTSVSMVGGEVDGLTPLQSW